MKNRLVVFLRRTSTKTTWGRKRGIRSQRKAAQRYALENQKEIVGEYYETDTKQWPVLHQAIEQAREAGAALLIVRVGRLTRNLSFLTVLKKAFVDFICLDSPTINRKTIDRVLETAKQENRQIRQTMKDTLGRLKKEGVKLGSARPGHWEGRQKKRGWKQAVLAATVARQERAKSHYEVVYPIMMELFEQARKEAAEARQRQFAAMLEIRQRYEPLLERATGEEREAIRQEVKAKLREARRLGSYRTWDKVCEWLTERGVLTTRGMPFTPTALLRVKKAREQEEQS